MQIVGNDSPEFYKSAAIIRQYLPFAVFNNGSKVMFDKGRYYALLNIDDAGNLTYDHVCSDATWMTPMHVFMSLETAFGFGGVINAFVAPSNARSIRFLNGVGFIKTGTLRQMGGNWDIFSMTAQEWKNNRIRRHIIEKQTQN